MRQLLKNPHAWLWVAALVAGLVVSLLTVRFVEAPNALPISVFILALFLGLAWWSWWSRQRELRVEKNRQVIIDDLKLQDELRQQFSLCKPAEELRPEDLGFQPLWPDQQIDPHFRPFYVTYIPRRIVPSDEMAIEQPTTVYTEAMLRDELRNGGKFVLLGQPTMGKSRTLFEIVRGMKGWVVVSPRKDAESPRSEPL